MHGRIPHTFHCLIIPEIVSFINKATVHKSLYENRKHSQVSTFLQGSILLAPSVIALQSVSVTLVLILLPRSQVSSTTNSSLISSLLKSRKGYIKCPCDCWLPRAHYWELVSIPMVQGQDREHQIHWLKWLSHWLHHLGCFLFIVSY